MSQPGRLVIAALRKLDEATRNVAVHSVEGADAQIHAPIALKLDGRGEIIGLHGQLDAHLVQICLHQLPQGDAGAVVGGNHGVELQLSVLISRLPQQPSGPFGVIAVGLILLPVGRHGGHIGVHGDPQRAIGDLGRGIRVDGTGDGLPDPGVGKSLIIGRQADNGIVTG